MKGNVFGIYYMHSTYNSLFSAIGWKVVNGHGSDLTILYCHEYYLFQMNKGGEGGLMDKADCLGGLKKGCVLPFTITKHPLLSARG